MKFRSLSLRMTLYSFGLTYLLLLTCWGLLYFSVERALLAKDQGVVADRLTTITNLLSPEAEPGALASRVESEWPRRSFEHIFVRVLNANGDKITATPDLPASLSELFPQDGKAFAGIPALNKIQIAASTYEVGTFTISGRAQETVRVEIALERTSEDVLLGTLREGLAYVLVFGLIASLWSGRLTVARTMKSIREITDTAQRVSHGDLKERVKADQLPTEFAGIAGTLNEMLSRLEDSFERLSRFSADMAHELRTPLNNLLISMEVSLTKKRSADEYQELIASSIEEAERLKRIIDSLLFIASAQQPSHEIHKQDLNLLGELRTILHFYEPAAEKRRVHMQLEVNPELYLLAEKTLFQRAVGNLLANAIRWTEEKSQVTVRAEQDGQYIVIAVEDQGPGLAPELLPQVGERFFRVEKSRSQSSGGHGLGLSIVKSIVEIHGGTLRVESKVGHGSTFYISFAIT